MYFVINYLDYKKIVISISKEVHYYFNLNKTL